MFHLRPQSTQLGAAAKFECDLVDLLTQRHHGQAAVDRYLDNELPSNGDDELHAQSTFDLAGPFETVVLEVRWLCVAGRLCPCTTTRPSHSHARLTLPPPPSTLTAQILAEGGEGGRGAGGEGGRNLQRSRQKIKQKHYL